MATVASAAVAAARTKFLTAFLLTLGELPVGPPDVTRDMCRIHSAGGGEEAERATAGQLLGFC
jgi:hypothetical protein